MIHPLLNMTLRGIAWYQGKRPPPQHGAAPRCPPRPLSSPLLSGPGEANAFLHTDQYNCTFPALIADWRRAFHTGSAGQTEPLLPFGFVQVRWGSKGQDPHPPVGMVA